MCYLRHSFVALLLFVFGAFAQSPTRTEPSLGIGDVLRISVYQNPDLSVEARISETGQINFPLVGLVRLAGLTIFAAEQRLEKALRDGGFVLRPQVRIQMAQIRSNQVSILGQVGRPGRYPIEVAAARFLK